MQPSAMFPALFPGTDWFIEAQRHKAVILPLNRHWNKREKATHRYRVADVNGEIALTVPVEKPESLTRCVYSDIRLSKHGNWWHVHRVTLESGYGRTPFFEHYFPKLDEFFRDDTVDRYPFLWQYTLATAQKIAEILDLDATIMTGIDDSGAKITQCSGANMEEYWQVRRDKLGFIPGLSVLDLIFSLGPEAKLRMIEN